VQYPPPGGQWGPGQYPQAPYQGQQGYPGYPQGGYPPPKKSNIGLVIGLVVGGLVLVVLAVGGFIAARVSKAAKIEAECADREPTSRCKIYGDCFLNDDGTGCIAKQASDCRASKRCKEDGKCSLEYHACTASSAADCAQSTSCTISGKCDLVVHECRPTTTGHCSRSTMCLQSNKYCYYDSTMHDCNNTESTSSSSSSSSSSGGTTYTCKPGCTYVGNGMCRCRR
jgi:hypothetical protein